MGLMEVSVCLERRKCIGLGDSSILEHIFVNPIKASQPIIKYIDADTIAILASMLLHVALSKAGVEIL